MAYRMVLINKIMMLQWMEIYHSQGNESKRICLVLCYGCLPLFFTLVSIGFGDSWSSNCLILFLAVKIFFWTYMSEFCCLSLNYGMMNINSSSSFPPSIHSLLVKMGHHASPSSSLSCLYDQSGSYCPISLLYCYIGTQTGGISCPM